MLLSPLTTLDVEGTYDRYQAGIDLILYIILLSFIARVSLAQVFPSEHGRKLATVVGVVLGISLSATAHTLGFSLKAFGPVAAFMVVFVVGLVLYTLLRHGGAGHSASGSMALLVTYFTMRAIQPGFFLWAGKNEWLSYLHGLLLLAIFVALWNVIAAIFAPQTLGNVTRVLDRLGDGIPPDTARVLRNTQSGLAGIKHDLDLLNSLELGDANDLIEALEQIVSMTRQHGNQPGAGTVIARQLRKIRKRQHRLQAEVERFRKLDKRLLRLDLGMHAELQSAAKRLNGRQRQECLRAFVQEREAQNVESRIEEFFRVASRHSSQFQRCLRNAATSLRANHAEPAVEWLQRALQLEREAVAAVEDVKCLENKLIGIMEQQLARFEAAADR